MKPRPVAYLATVITVRGSVPPAGRRRKVRSRTLVAYGRRVSTNTGRLRRRPDVLWRRSPDAVLLLPPGASEPVTLTGTGLDLWDLLAVPTSSADLARVLAARYGADPADVEADVVPVLDELAGCGALETVD